MFYCESQHTTRAPFNRSLRSILGRPLSRPPLSLSQQPPIRCPPDASADVCFIAARGVGLPSAKAYFVLTLDARKSEYTLFAKSLRLHERPVPGPGLMYNQCTLRINSYRRARWKTNLLFGRASVPVRECSSVPF